MLSQTLIAFWFETRNGKGRVIRPLQDCVLPRPSGWYVRVRYQPCTAPDTEQTVLVYAPTALASARPKVQRAVLMNILRRGHMPVGKIIAIEEVQAGSSVFQTFHP